MRAFLLAVALAASILTPVAKAQDRALPQVSVIVLTLDQLRQVQARHGRSVLAAVGDERWGTMALVEPALSPTLFEACRNRRPDDGLDYCVRYLLTRAELTADAPPTVVVAFEDGPSAAPDRRGGEMRMACYGRGVVPAEPAAQFTWLWPDSARMHGVNDLNRDREAMRACIHAAASEPWTGLRQPDVD